MKILLTGANGYIGTRLLPALIEAGHHVVALVRSADRLYIPSHLRNHVDVLEGDLLKRESLAQIPQDIDTAYYLVHSMSARGEDFSELEAKSAQNFSDALEATSTKQVIYLGGLTSGSKFSKHMTSRRRVEEILGNGSIPLTTLRAGVIIGSGSASFEIIRDLVEKLPVMITPSWVRNRCQPIAIADVIFYLKEVLGKSECLGTTFEIGGPDIMTYQDVLTGFAKTRGLRRLIIGVPVLTPRLSSYWLIFITSSNFALAQALVDSLKAEAICRNTQINDLIPHQCLTYQEALSIDLAQPPQFEGAKFGLKYETLNRVFSCSQQEACDHLERLSHSKDWWYLTGARHWQILSSDQRQEHVVLFAKVGRLGEAWLGFSLGPGSLRQAARFRPRGLLGRLYWIVMFPIRRPMLRRISRKIMGRS